MNDIWLLKLGGSLITNKHKPYTARKRILLRLAQEIYTCIDKNPDIKLIVGHGSGSFGHFAAQKYGTRNGVHTEEEWKGFIEVWNRARDLHLIVVEAMQKAGVPIISFPPSAGIQTQNGRIDTWDLLPLRSALEAGLVPMTYGDVVFDRALGGVIVSTEEIFVHLASHIPVQRILLAGIEAGVWQDYPYRKRLLKQIKSEDLSTFSSNLLGSKAIDVTGGMAKKVETMVEVVRENHDTSVQIFSAVKPHQLTDALMGHASGTTITH